MTSAPFRFVDLFSGIGGFHALLAHLGGDLALAAEIDPRASDVYRRNWLPHGSTALRADVTKIDAADVPPHQVLTAGFPCQAFSKSGLQRGISEARGTLFFDILRILERRTPPLILLENVRNLVGPRHHDTWSSIVRLLRQVGYRVSSEPAVFSPHLLPPHMAGQPQIRERVFIAGTYVGRQRAQHEDPPPVVTPRTRVGGWQPRQWRLEHVLDPSVRAPLSAEEISWIEVWDDFVRRLRERREGAPLPGFPLWADYFVSRPATDPTMPAWKRALVRKNVDFYDQNRDEIRAWKAEHPELRRFPASRRKLEWQAQELGSLWDCVIQFRPSGIRVKQPTYLPALVAMAQTPIIGPRRRRLTTREAARLQGLPDWFDFGEQADTSTFRQLGNGINIGAAWWVLREHVEREQQDLPHLLVNAVLSAPAPLRHAITAPGSSDAGAEPAA